MDATRKQVCCFTGHREIPSDKRVEIVNRLEQTIISLHKQGIRTYEAGGALGFDTLASQTVLRLRERYPDMKLILVLPCLTQTRGWKAEDIAKYEHIKAQADQVIYTGQQYTRGCMHKRNRYLVDHSGVCVCYLNKNSGGTAYTVGYAKKHGFVVINLAQSEKCLPQGTSIIKASAVH